MYLSIKHKIREIQEEKIGIFTITPYGKIS
jgi:hypothetical protein